MVSQDAGEVGCRQVGKVSAGPLEGGVVGIVSLYRRDIRVVLRFVVGRVEQLLPRRVRAVIEPYLIRPAKKEQ